MVKGWELIRRTRSIFNVLRNVRIDGIALGISLGRDGPSFTRFIQFTFAATLITRINTNLKITFRHLKGVGVK